MGLNIGEKLKNELKDRLDISKGKLKQQLMDVVNKKKEDLIGEAKRKASQWIKNKLDPLDKKISKATGGLFGDHILQDLVGKSEIGKFLGDGSTIHSITSAEDKTFSVKYQVPNLIFMIGSESIPMNMSNILSIEYMNNYDFDIMPILKISLRMDIRQKLLILKNKRDVQVKLEIDRIGRDLSNEEFITSPVELWNSVFNLYLSDEDESIDINDLNERLAQNEENPDQQDPNKENYYESQNVFEIYLLNKELLEASRFSFNKVYTETNLQNAIGQMLTESGHKAVLMSKIENDEVYKELVLPPNPVYKQLIYLDQYYGLYKNGAMIYYDIDRLYVLNLTGRITAARQGQWNETTFVVTNNQNSIPGNGMIHKGGDATYFPSILNSDINTTNFTRNESESEGKLTKIVVTDTTDIDVNQDVESNGSNNAINYEYIKDSNKYTQEVVRARRAENENMLYISAENLDISAFTPNKVYRVVYDDETNQQKYGNRLYRICYGYHYLAMEGEEYMKAAHHITLKQVEESAENTSENKPLGSWDSIVSEIFGGGTSIGEASSDPPLTAGGGFGGAFKQRSNSTLGNILGSILGNVAGNQKNNDYLQKFGEILSAKKKGSSSDITSSSAYESIMKKKEEILKGKILH